MGAFSFYSSTRLRWDQVLLGFRAEIVNGLSEIIDHPNGLHNVHDMTIGSMSSDSSLDRDGDLADQLLSQMVMSSFDEKEFLPHGCIDAIITREAVLRELDTGRSHVAAEAGQEKQYELDSLVDFIMLRGKTVFAILICIFFSSRRIWRAMAQFRSLEFDDSKLPIILEDGSSHLSKFFSVGKAYRKPWSALSVRQFRSNQWKFLAPIFLDGQSQLKLHENAILPFTATRGIMAVGNVHEVTIHPAHRKHIGVQVRIFNIRAKDR